MVNLLILLVGLALIIKGGDWFVGASVRIAQWLRMPWVVIGSTLVSLATTTPELTVSQVAGWQALVDRTGVLPCLGWGSL